MTGSCWGYLYLISRVFDVVNEGLRGASPSLAAGYLVASDDVVSVFSEGANH
jgi:hypothetical protein